MRFLTPRAATAPLRWLLVVVLALLAATCGEGEGVSPSGGPVALVALDLTDVGRHMATAGDVPAEVLVYVDGEPIGTVELPEPDGLLAGHASLALGSAGSVSIQLEVRTASGARWYGEGTLDVGQGEVAVAGVSLSGDRELRLVAERSAALHEAVLLDVAFRAPDRPAVLLAPVGPEAAAHLAAILADPAVQVVTPFAEQADPVDEIGPLVALQPVAVEPAPVSTRVPPAAERVAAEPATVELVNPAPLRPVQWPSLARIEAEPPVSLGDFVYYFSYCDCGKPVPNRAYTLTTAAGETLQGITDPYGFALHPGLAGARIDFGASQRPRNRSYAFEPADPGAEASLLAALTSEIVGDQLTALLDLRRAPLPEAFEILVALLDHPDAIVWRNAAVTLSFYADLGPVVADRLARLEAATGASDNDTEARELAILGGLRQPAALDALTRALGSAAPTVRATAAWALGFVGAASSRVALVQHFGDEDSTVRDAARLAVKRL